MKEKCYILFESDYEQLQNLLQLMHDVKDLSKIKNTLKEKAFGVSYNLQNVCIRNIEIDKNTFQMQVIDDELNKEE